MRIPKLVLRKSAERHRINEFFKWKSGSGYDFVNTLSTMLVFFAEFQAHIRLFRILKTITLGLSY